MNPAKKIASSTEVSPEQLEELASAADAAVRRAVARNTRTPTQTLERLSHDSDKSTRQAVASNPNTPADTLMRLGAQFPDQLLENPALDALVIENPNLFSKVPEQTLAAIAKRATCPTEVLGYLARAGHGKGLLMSLIQNGQTPHDAIRYIGDTDAETLAARHETPEHDIRLVKRQVVHHVAVRGEVSADEARSALWSAVKERILTAEGAEVGDLLNQALIPQIETDEIAAWTLLLKGGAVACRTVRLPASLLEATACVADKRNLKLIQACAECPAWLSKVGSAEEARQAIETHRTESEALWREATASGSEAVTLALANHPLAPGSANAAEILNRLARSKIEAGWKFLAGRDDERSILWFIASSTLTAPGTLEFLFESVQVKDRPRLPLNLARLQRPELLKALDKWLRVPNRTLEELESASGIFASTDSLIASHDNFNLPDHLRIRWYLKGDLLDYLGENPNTPLYVLKALAEWGEVSVAKNSAADEAALRTLYSLRPNRVVAEGLAANPSCPPDLLAEVAKSKDREYVEYVLPALAANPSSPEEALLMVATCKQWRDLFEFDDTDRKLINHPNSTGRVLDTLIAKNRVDLESNGVRLARDTRLSEASFECLAKLRDGAVRKQLAANPSISTEILLRLSRDKEESVKKTAQRALKQREIGAAH